MKSRKNSKRELLDILTTSQKTYKPSKRLLKEVLIRDYKKTCQQAIKNPIKFD